MTPKNKLVLKILVWSFLVHVILIALTFLEVFIYSALINSGQDIQFYEQHAEVSGPYIGILVGFPLVYLMVKSLLKKNPASQKLIGFGLPLGYIFLDVIMVVLSGVVFLPYLWTFAVSYLTKLLAGYLAMKTTKG